ncbi:hypothetical protein SAMCFNEI73_pB0359 (plasmid) [Sinorhizobium americanum]|uniref:Uncharacterized protein n=1 Tax=Sinorhizobium americanum TaxID=194963 RepID=A0A1L3LU25_9HYPH|nr:hypothetical protein SAMCCGM7_pB0331 [Sinorhizobium americanum CCGM7]APG93556.1 hypothetical protein SAMCFNEI73_pB0359 [Sinorhizobium americanum]
MVREGDLLPLATGSGGRVVLRFLVKAENLRNYSASRFLQLDW